MLLKPWFLIALSLAAAHQLLQKLWTVPINMIDSFLDPLLFIPIVLHLTLMERRFLFGKGPLYILPRLHILLIVGVVSFVCELLFPLWSDSFTADPLDAVCYILGGLAFGIFFNGPIYENDSAGQTKRADPR